MSTYEEQSIRRFFTDEEWNKISRYEKLRCINLKRNYDVMIGLGLTAQMPDFMLPTYKLRKRPNLKDENEIVDVETLSDGEEEWLPQKENQKTSSKKKTATKKILPKKAKPKENLDVKVQQLTSSLEPKPSTSQTSFPVRKKKHVKDNDSMNGVRYPLRKVKRISYTEMDITDDSYIFCDECDAEHPGDCPTHGPLTVVKDVEIPMGEENRAERTLPPRMSIGPSRIKNAGKGVWTEGFIPKGVRFGPYEGVIVSDAEEAHKSGYCWEIFRVKQPPVYIDASNETTSNWMRYVNCARNDEEQNLVAFQYLGKIYYRTFRMVPDSVELLVWYGDKYAEELGLHSLHSVKTLGSTGKAGTKEKEEGDGLQDVSSLRLFPCHSCSCVMLSALSLICHIQKKHTEKEEQLKRHQCPHCPYSTDKTTHLLHHIRTHTRERPFVCVYCKKGFTTKRCVEIHERTVHRREKPFACQVCGKKFGMESNCRKHVKNIHLNQTHFKCTICGKRCFLKIDLSVHMRVHTGEKLFACDACGKRFAQSSNLKRHTRIHTGEKLFACDVCGKRFAQSADLKRHTRTHTGEKPYQCSVCQARFSHSFSLRYHQRTRNHVLTDHDSNDKEIERELLCQPAQMNNNVKNSVSQQPRTNERFCNTNNLFKSEE